MLMKIGNGIVDRFAGEVISVQAARRHRCCRAEMR